MRTSARRNKRLQELAFKLLGAFVLSAWVLITMLGNMLTDCWR